MRSGNTTVPASTDDSATLRAIVDTAPALVIVWSAQEPHWVEEIAMLDTVGPWVLGRPAEDVTQVPFCDNARAGR